MGPYGTIQSTSLPSSLRSYFDLLEGDWVEPGLCGQPFSIARIDAAQVLSHQRANYLGRPAAAVDVGELVEIPLEEEDLVSCELLGTFHHRLGSFIWGRSKPGPRLRLLGGRGSLRPRAAPRRDVGPKRWAASTL